MSTRATGEGDGITTLDHALERICFLQWRLEQLEASLQDARLKNQGLRAELSELSHEQTRDGARQVSLKEQLTEARREVQSIEERMALSERARASAEAHTRELQAQIIGRGSELSAEAERERQRAEVASRSLSDARERIDNLERAHARFFLRLAEWQRLLGSDPDRIDLAEFIAELRAEVVRLSGERDLSVRREQRLRLALVEVGAPLPADAALQAELPSPPPASAAAVAAVAGAQQLIESLAQEAKAPQIATDASAPEAAQPPAEAAEAPPPTAPEATELRAAVKARMGQLSPDDAGAAFAHLPEPVQTSAQPLLRELAQASTERALHAGVALARLDAEAAAPAIVARMRADGEPVQRWLAVLGKAAGPMARTAAFKAFDSPDGAIRATALETLLALSPDEAHTKLLTRGLDDRDAHVRRRAVLAAQSCLGRRAEPLLHALLDDADPATRRLVTTVLRGPRPATASAVVSSTRRRSPWSK